MKPCIPSPQHMHIPVSTRARTTHTHTHTLPHTYRETHIHLRDRHTKDKGPQKWTQLRKTIKLHPSTDLLFSPLHPQKPRPHCRTCEWTRSHLGKDFFAHINHLYTSYQISLTLPVKLKSNSKNLRERAGTRRGGGGGQQGHVTQAEPQVMQL